MQSEVRSDAPTRPASRAAEPRSREAPSERYQLETEIARGGMGRVVEAFDRELDRQVAIKEALTADSDTLLRFAREIWITARLEHPAIVPLYDAGKRADGTPFYVMRKIGGRPLVELVEEAVTVEARLALVPHVLAAARAIAHAHQRQVVHRDLKPGNILVGALGETVVIDWGLAKLYGEVDEGDDQARSPVADAVATRVGVVMGTPGFMPPEQLAGGAADPRVDVYALGATLYYVLSRKLPHAQTSTAELLHAVAQPATPISTLVPEVPRDLAAIVDVAISPDRERRFVDASAMAAELERFLAGRLIASRHYTRRERLARFVGRHRVAVLTVVIATLALAIGGAFAVDRVLSERRRAEEALVDAVRERATAQELLDTMTLDRARSLVESNPTAAVALVRGLATGGRWREVRAIVAEAQTRGVASSMPGPELAMTLAIAPTAPRAAVVDVTGRVWTYDLDAHRATDRGMFTPAGTHAEFIDDTRLVIAERAKTTILDLVTGARRSFPVGGTITTAAGYLLLQGREGRVVELDLETGATRPLGQFVSEPTVLGLSHQGAWVTLRTATGITVVERATGRVIGEVASGPVLVRWDPERADRFVMVELDRVSVVSVDGAGVNRRELATGDFGTAAIASGRVCLAGMKSIGFLEPTDQRQPIVPGGLPLVVSGAHGLCYGLASTRIAVMGGLVPHELISPIEIKRFVGAPRNPYVVAAGVRRIVAWRVEPPPRRLLETGALALQPIGPHGVVYRRNTDNTSGWTHVDLATGRVDELPVPGGAFLGSLVPDRAGKVIAIVDELRQPARVIVIGLATRQTKILEVEAPVIAVGGRVALATRDGVVVSIINADGSMVEGARGTAPMSSMHVSPTVLAVVWADRRLWVQTPQGTRTRTHDKLVAHLHAIDTGDVFLVTDDKTIEVWHPDNRIVALAKTSLPIEGLVSSAPDHLLVALEGGALSRIELPGGTERILAVGAQLSLATTSSRGLISRGGELDLFELDVGTHWKVKVPSSPNPPVLSHDGRWIAIPVGRVLYTLLIDLPESPAALAERIELLTNAEVDRKAPSSVIRWRD